jgi:hypothetical protein
MEVDKDHVNIVLALIFAQSLAIAVDRSQTIGSENRKLKKAQRGGTQLDF